MNERRRDPAKYHISSPRQLNKTCLLSVRLRRARGFVSSRSAPAISTVSPRVADTLKDGFCRRLRTSRRRSSIVGAEMYIGEFLRAPFDFALFSQRAQALVELLEDPLWRVNDVL